MLQRPRHHVVQILRFAILVSGGRHFAITNGIELFVLPDPGPAVILLPGHEVIALLYFTAGLISLPPQQR